MAAPVTQETLDKIAQLIQERKSDREIAKELGICYVSISRWRKQGRLPEPYRPKTNNGKVREYEPLPKLQPGQRLDGTPIIKQEAKKVIEVEKASVEEKVAEPVKPVKRRIMRFTSLRGEYITLEISGGDVAVDFGDTMRQCSSRDALQILMDLEAEVHELIGEVEKLL